MADHGTSGTSEIKSEHNLVQSINGRKTIYCSPGHVVVIVDLNNEQEELINFLSSHQIKENFSYIKRCREIFYDNQINFFNFKNIYLQ